MTTGHYDLRVPVCAGLTSVRRALSPTRTRDRRRPQRGLAEGGRDRRTGPRSRWSRPHRADSSTLSPSRTTNSSSATSAAATNSTSIPSRPHQLDRRFLPVLLLNIPENVDYDLTIYGPASRVAARPARPDLPGLGDVASISTPRTTVSTDVVNDIAVHIADIAPKVPDLARSTATTRCAIISNYRPNNDEEVTIPALAGGTDLPRRRVRLLRRPQPRTLRAPRPPRLAATRSPSAPRQPLA